MMFYSFILISLLTTMADPPQQQTGQTQQTDPKTSLTNEDLIRFLMKHCHDTCRIVVNESIRDEREHSNEKLKLVIDGLSFLASTFNKQNKDYNEKLEAIERNIEALKSDFNPAYKNDLAQIVRRISDLEHKFDSTLRNFTASVDTFEEALASTNLKTVTSSLYHEQLLYSLKHALFNTSA